MREFLSRGLNEHGLFMKLRMSASMGTYARYNYAVEEVFNLHRLFPTLSPSRQHLLEFRAGSVVSRCRKIPQRTDVFPAYSKRNEI